MSDTRLRPEHFGEPMVCAVLQRIAESGRLDQVRCHSPNSRSSVSFAEAINTLGFQQPLRFHDNVPLAPILCDECTVAFDGLSRIDCILEDGKQAVALEVKLGTKLMAATKFAERFFSACDWSNHVPARVKGNMIAVLDGRFVQPQLASEPLVVELAGGDTLPVIQAWFLLLRQEVWKKWEKNTPTFQRPCQILLLEELVPAVGGPTGFDEIVRQLVGSEFAVSWGLAQ